MKKLFAKSILVIAAIAFALVALLVTHRVPPTEAAGSRWPGNEVPYYIDRNVSPDHRNAIEKAIEIWEDRTALNFKKLDAAYLQQIPKDEARPAYLHYIDRGSKYHSYEYSDIEAEGDLDAFPYLRDGDWVIKLNDCGPICGGDNEPFGTNYHIPLHETGHVLGLPHEAKRSDRGTEVRFYPCCADESEESFAKSLQHVEALKPYDLKSIMQYSSTTHCKDSGGKCLCLPLLEKTSQIYAPDSELVSRYQQTENEAGECADKLDVTGRVIEENPGLSFEDVNTIYQMYPPTLGNSEDGDHFGEAMAAGDFDGDGYSDLAVGAPGEAPGDDPQSGAVFLFKGTFTGLVPWRTLTQTGLGVNQSGDQFGQTLAAGDFNDDGQAELIVGAPGEKVDGFRGGAVFVFLGSITGPTTENGYTLTQENIGFSGGSNDNDSFGAALAVGNFNGDSRVDLAIGAPGKNPGGRVYTLKWDKSRASGDKFVKFDRLGSQRVAGDLFGTALVAADVNSDGFDDLVVGGPGTDGVGAIFVFTGGSGKFHDGTQIKQPLGSTREPFDAFGAALATGHFSGGAKPQIVVGAPGKKGSGKIYVLRLRYNGNSYKEIDLWNSYDQETLAVNSTGDNFGQFFAVADFDRDGKDDLAVGIPLKDLYIYSESGAETVFDAGAVALFRGNTNNDFLKEWTIYYQPTSYGTYRLEHRFGGAIAAANFNREPAIPDLAIGVPGKNGDGSTASGAMFVARGANEGDPPKLSQDTNPSKAAEPPDQPSFWHFFNQELADRR